MSAHLIALILSHRTGLPWVADFRDPWIGNPFRDLPYASLRRWDAWLERRVVNQASHIICATTTMSDALSRRIPGLHDKCSTIWNGFDAHRLCGLQPKRTAPDDHFVLTHCGQFYGGRSPHVWFQAVRRLRKTAPEPAAKFRLTLIGPPTFDGVSLSDLSRSCGVADLVEVQGQRSHTEALAHMAGSDALMLAASDGPGADLQVPNKLFEYLAVQKPIIATCSRRNPIVDILYKASAEAIVCEPNDVNALCHGLMRMVHRRSVEVASPRSKVGQFERSCRARELVTVFERVLRGVRVSDRSLAGRSSFPLKHRDRMVSISDVGTHPA